MRKCKKNKKKRTAKGQVSLTTDRGRLRISFPSEISRKLFNKRQYHLYLGLKDTPEDRETAEKIRNQIELDIRANKLHNPLDPYLPHSQLKEQVGVFYDPNRIEITLLELFDQWCEFKKPQLSYSTYQRRYINRYRKAAVQCPQDLNKQAEISLKIAEVLGPSETGRTHDAFYECLEWGRDLVKIPAQAENNFRKLKKYLNTKPSPKKPNKFLANLPGYVEDPDYCAFSSAEAQMIIARFLELGVQKPDCAYLHDLICFLFWTGCRTGEATGLTWNNVAPDCSYVIFRQTYDDTFEKKLKPLKTEKKGQEGADARKFPCGKKLEALLLKRRSHPHDPKGFVFTNSQGNPVGRSSITEKWLGNEQRYEIGVVPKLVREGKVKQYLSPYHTRHSFITWQLHHGVLPKDVAKLVGNSPGTILRHYQGFYDDVDLAPEI
jgi:integrase